MRDGYWDNNNRGGGSANGSALDHLNSALDALERQMGMGGAPRQPAAPPAPGYANEQGAIMRRREELDRQRASRQAAMREAEARAARRQLEEEYAYRQAAQSQAYMPQGQRYAGDAQAAENARRAQELRDELANLRSELHREQQVGAMRAAQPAPAIDMPDYNPQFESLRAEIESIRSDVNLLARDDTIRDLSDRWGVLEREFASLPDVLSTRDDVARVGQRVQDMAIALEELPRTIPIAAMEQQLTTLANAVERVSETNLQLPPSYFENVDQRLDEISGAVTGLINQSRQHSAALDPAVLEAMENRLAALIGDLDSKHQMPDLSGLARVGEHVEALQASLGSVASGDDIQAMSDRLNDITSAVHAMARVAAETGAAIHPDMLADMQQSVTAIAARLDDHREAARETASVITTSLDARMNELAAQIGQQSAARIDIPDLDDLRQQMARLNEELSGIKLPAGGFDSDAIVSRTVDAVRSGLREDLATIGGPDNSDTIVSRTVDAVRSAMREDLAAIGTLGSPDNGDALVNRTVAAVRAGLREDLATISGSDNSDAIVSRTVEAVRAGLRDDLSSIRADASGDKAAMTRFEQRLDQIAQQLDTALSTPATAAAAEPVDLSPVTDQIERLRIDLEGRIEVLAAQASAMGDQEPDPEAMNALTRMEERLNLLSGMVAEMQGAAAPDISRLEAQVAELASHLAAGLQHTAQGAPQSDERFEALERKLDSAGEDAAGTAIRAAETAIQRFAEENRDADPEVVNHLTSRMGELDKMLRSATDRNDQAFGAIHDTLLKVVEHLSRMQASPAPAAGASPAVHDDRDNHDGGAPVAFGGQDVPPLAPQADDYSQPKRNGRAQQRMAPAQAAAAAALAALNNEEGMSIPDVELPQPTATHMPDMGDFDDTPLEPNSGGPDLASIIQRVRDEKATGPVAARVGIQHDDADPGKSDFIAAARRAAQAAAADTTVADTNGKKEKSAGLSALLAKVTGNRKKVLMGVGGLAAAVVILPLVGSLLFGSGGDDYDLAEFDRPQNEFGMANSGSMDMADGGALLNGESAFSGTMASDPSGDIAMSGADAPESMEADGGPVDFAMDPAGAGMDAGPVDLAMADPQAPLGAGEPVAANPSGFTAPAIPDAIGPVALREAAEAGDARALYIIGDKILAGEDGSGSAQGGLNHEGAAPFYRVAADAGYAVAQYRYGNLLEKGTGVQKDLPQAERYYRLAAEQGNASAMHNLGALLAGNSGGAPDFAAAARWFARAGELGVADSQFNLGILYGLGNGVERDLAESYKWFALAADNGDTMAADKRDEVAAQLTDEDRQLAESTLKLWRQKPLASEANMVAIPDAWKTGAQAVASTTAQPTPDPEEMKRAVRNIQAILNNAGYDAGSVDGIMGGRTRDAIISFQKDNGMEPTGNVDQALVQKLLEVNGAG